MFFVNVITKNYKIGKYVISIKDSLSIK